VRVNHEIGILTLSIGLRFLTTRAFSNAISLWPARMRMINRNVLKIALSMTRYFGLNVTENQSHSVYSDFWRRTGMPDLILITLSSLLSGLRGQAALQAENIALRHQVTVLQRTHTKRPILKPGDRCLWVWLSRLWSGWRSALIIVMP
jgi:hypothetical protein